MPANVLDVTPKTWNKDGQNITTYWVTLDDRTDDVPSYDERAKDLTKGPLPDGWEVATSTKGKPYLKAPKSGGKGGFAQSWYNSEAGVHFTQERMDRRTALMQAVAFGESGDNLWRLADDMYAWLSGSPSLGAAEGAPITSAVGGGGTRTDPKPPELQPEVKDAEPDGEAGRATLADGPRGEAVVGGTASPADTIHIHEWKEAPREGWQMCASCGAAEKKKVPRG